MIAFDDIDQFRGLVAQLPEAGFDSRDRSHPRIALFAATHAESDIAPVQAMVAELPFDAAFTAAVAKADADLRLYELDLAHPAATLSPREAAHVIAYGMTAIESGPDIFALAAIGDHTRTIDGFAQGEDPLMLLASQGGRDTCALFGALLATRMAGLAAIVDGAPGLAAIAVLHALRPGAASHCAVPLGSAHENAARQMGLAIVPCADTRPLYALADCILQARTVAA